MDRIMFLAVFLAIAGLVMIAGSFWMLKRYHERINRMSDQDLIDDEARKEGTVLFIVGGIVFLAAAALIFFTQFFRGA